MKVEDPDNFFMHDIQTPVNITDINTSVADYEREIENIPMHSSPAPDSWNSIFIKKCKVPVAQALSIVWRKSLDTAEIPDALKSADPVHTGGSKELAKNYRPVALTFHIIKIFERVIRSQVASFMGTNDLHNPR
ncbi:uncharacterized protein [Procambarus clarkii]|uniref:uncharacterized protein n=1 Tax=Procambarus clarkii TaxID=6728 RepID=UPI0037447060